MKSLRWMAFGAVAVWGTVAQAADPVPFVPLRFCNDFWQGFKVSVDGRLPQAVPAGKCTTVQVPAGDRAIFPLAYLFSQDYFRHGAWIVNVPAGGATVRFGTRGTLCDIVAVEGAPGAAQRTVEMPPRPSPGEPLFLTSAAAPVPIQSWFTCWQPFSFTDVFFDRATPVGIAPHYFSTFTTGFGIGGVLGAYDLFGDPACTYGYLGDPRYVFRGGRLPVVRPVPDRTDVSGVVQAAGVDRGALRLNRVPSGVYPTVRAFPSAFARPQPVALPRPYASSIRPMRSGPVGR